MKICAMLYNAINFEPTGIQPCCDVRAIGVPSFAFGGGALNVAEYRQYLDTVLEKLQAGEEVCRGCPDLFETEVMPVLPENGLRLQSVSFNQHRYFCNCRCVYCGLWQKKSAEKPYPVLPALISLREQNALAEDCVFSWGGGEPSILPEFEAACSWIMEHGYFQYVHTSALYYSQAVADMLAAGKGKINISLDSGDAASYERVKGLDGWSKVVGNLEKYAAASIDAVQIDLKYIIFDLTNDIPVLEKFFRLCQRLALKNVQYSFDFREANQGRVSEKSLLAAAFFQGRAKQLGIDVDGFYVDAPLKERIDALGREHFNY